MTVLVAFNRKPGYEDVHVDILLEDAMRSGWTWEIAKDDENQVVISVDRPEGYERVAAREVAQDAVKPSWAWSLVKTSRLSST